MRTRRRAATSSTLFCVPAKLAPVHPRFAVYAVNAICSLKSHVPRRRSFGGWTRPRNAWNSSATHRGRPWRL